MSDVIHDSPPGEVHASRISAPVRLRGFDEPVRLSAVAPAREEAGQASRTTGIYELRAKAGRNQYRMLYFFHGRQAVVISHGITKQASAVPPIENERARRRRQAFEAAPPRHTHTETP